MTSNILSLDEISIHHRNLNHFCLAEVQILAVSLILSKLLFTHM